MPLSSLAYLFGLGASWNASGGYGGTVDDFPTHLAVELDAGYPMERDLAVGGHMRFSSAHAWEWDSDNTSATTWDYVMRTLDVGPSAMWTPGPFFVEPWLGLHLAYTTKRTTRTTWGPPPTNTPMTDTSADSYLAEPLLAAGFLAGMDFLTTRTLRASVFAEIEDCTAITSSTGSSAGRKYAAVTLGIGVRL